MVGNVVNMLKYILSCAWAIDLSMKFGRDEYGKKKQVLQIQDEGVFAGVLQGHGRPSLEYSVCINYRIRCLSINWIYMQPWKMWRFCEINFGHRFGICYGQYHLAFQKKYEDMSITVSHRRPFGISTLILYHHVIGMSINSVDEKKSLFTHLYWYHQDIVNFGI